MSSVTIQDILFPKLLFDRQIRVLRLLFAAICKMARGILAFVVCNLLFSLPLYSTDDRIAVEVGHLRFNVPAYLITPANTAWISSSISFSYHDNQYIEMNETSWEEYPKVNDLFDEITENGIGKIVDGVEIIGQQIKPILEYPSILISSYSEKQWKQNPTHYLNLVLKIKLSEGVISFRTLHTGFTHTDKDQFIENEKRQFIMWVKQFMPNYRWIGNHNSDKEEGYRTRYGLIKLSSLFPPTNFDIFVNYHDKTVITDLSITSSSHWRYRTIQRIISAFVQNWAAANTSIYLLNDLHLRQIKGRIGIELLFASEHGAEFYWFALMPLVNTDYTSFDIFGIITTPSNISVTEKEKAEYSVIWSRFANNL